MGAGPGPFGGEGWEGPYGGQMIGPNSGNCSGQGRGSWPQRGGMEYQGSEYGYRGGMGRAGGSGYDRRPTGRGRAVGVGGQGQGAAEEDKFKDIGDKLGKLIDLFEKNQN